MMVPLCAEEPITGGFAAPMTAAQQAWLCRTRAHVHAIAFDPRDPASAILLTERHRLHARLVEAHDVQVEYDGRKGYSRAFGTALTALPRFAAMRVLSLVLDEWNPGAVMMALPRGLRR